MSVKSLLVLALGLPACGVGMVGDDPANDGRLVAGASEAPRVVLLAIDDRTVEWARAHVSEFDGNPIGMSDGRPRELVARLLDQVQASRPAGLVVDLEFYGNPPQGAQATAALADAFGRVTVPVALCGPFNQAEREAEQTSPIYQALAGAVRGHCRADNHSAPYRVPLWDDGLYPLALVGFAAGAALDQELVIGEAQRCLADDSGSIPLQATSGEIVSAAEILEGSAGSRLTNAIVVVGLTYSGNSDFHPLLGDNVYRPGVYSHFWNMLRLTQVLAGACPGPAPTVLPNVPLLPPLPPRP